MAAHGRTVIITSYIDTPFDMNKELTPEDTVICTDGGYDIAKAAGITPDLVLGDLDSVKNEIPADIPVVKFKPEKDYTDLQLAIDTAIERGAEDIEIWGGIGGRLDHTIANIQLLNGYTDKVHWLVLRDGANLAFVIQAQPGRKYKLPAKEGWYLSFFALSEECTGITLTGVKYPITDYTLTNRFPLGVSNEFTDYVANLTFETGSLLTILSKM